jgi:hypothetical protein
MIHVRAAAAENTKNVALINDRGVFLSAFLEKPARGSVAASRKMGFKKKLPGPSFI